ncbi:MULTISPECIES: hypothetical protein [Solibacillus]|uniref:Uncharacterized protein n=1 Tax=Solibacillus merdavium TaxID=2762218 RepID=A0ABR8XR00_9BACL|nr:hypothetical protein [Solibacillus merdavium]MBD8034366.1 hypothetical protein [Solibacillus merdavium]
MYYMFTYEKLHPDAKTLTLMAANKVPENGVLYREENSKSPIKVVELEDIIINIDR